ncbi:MAG: sigma-70 family RNA polymerase sigma factor [Caldisericaceae bacterium]|nr:sigma-70 family RNA polymerase sigma factor [Caldisericaceae bacterium]
MKVEVVKRDIEFLSEPFQEQLEQKIKKLETLLKNFNPDLVFLKIDLEGNEKNKMYTTYLKLDLRSKVLKAKKSAKNLHLSTREAFNALFREVKKFKEFLRHEPDYRRKRYQESAEKSVVSLSLNEELKESYRNLIQSILPKLINFTRRELRSKSFFSDRDPSGILVKEIIDEAIANVASEIQSKFNKRELRRKLYREIMNIIEQKIEGRHKKPLSLEKEIYEVDEQDFFEFYQPDETLRLEDILPGQEWPEDQEELKLSLQEILEELPEDLRQAFTLTQLNDFSPEEVAMIQDKPVEKVKEEIEQARKIIQEKLTTV